MATKVKLMKLLQEIRGFAEMSQRRSQSKPPGLVLVQLRSSFNQKERARRRKLRIPIQMKELPDIPSSVQINHIKAKASPVIPAP